MTIRVVFHFIVLASALFLCSCNEGSLPGGEYAMSDEYMGDWQGEVDIDGKESPIAAQVVALGDQLYKCRVVEQFDTREEPVLEMFGSVTENGLVFEGISTTGGYPNTRWNGVVKGDRFEGTISGPGSKTFEMEKVVRLSPTLGEQPPAGAMVLFDGSSLEHWTHPGRGVGYIDLNGMMGGNNRVAYLKTIIVSPQGGPAMLEVGSDDGVKVWLNGAVVHENSAMRPHKFRDDKIPLVLEKSDNELMMKVSNAGGDWAVSAKLSVPEIKGRTVVKVDPSGSSEGRSRPVGGKGGFITLWQISGPFSVSGVSGEELLGYEYAPEKGKVKWKVLDLLDEQSSGANWRLVDGAMEVRGGSLITKQKFDDFKLHLEFRSPYMPEQRGQKRGNSGVYLQGRYEIQVLDSYALEGKDNECGGIYQIAAPRVNMCAPPGQWQTYDITFNAADYKNGKLKSPARVTVLHNGVMIHDDIVLPHPTPGGLDQDMSKTGPILLQDHGDKVQYRNIWIKEL